jgi:fumarate reductase subunit D
MSSSRPAHAKRISAEPLLWLCFGAGLVLSVGAGAVLDGAAKGAVTAVGLAVSLRAGVPLGRKPRIKALLAARPVLWFLFLFNGAVAAISGLSVEGVEGVTLAVLMGAVSLGAARGLLVGRRGSASA